MKKKVGYGLGDMGISIASFTVGFFFLYYLTDIVGMDPYLAGRFFLSSRLSGWSMPRTTSWPAQAGLPADEFSGYSTLAGAGVGLD